MTQIIPLPPDEWVQRTAAEYAEGWNNLLPTGPAWPRDPTTTIQQVITALAGIWGTEVEALAALLLQTESDPRFTNVLLPDWERAFGLPDICNPTPPTAITTREANLVAKMTFLGAQSRAFFIAQAAAIAGQTISIREYAPYMCGVSKCGDTSPKNTDNGPMIAVQAGGGTSTASNSIMLPSSYNVLTTGPGVGNVIQVAVGDFSIASVAGFTSGDTVVVSGVGGTVEANGTWVIDVMTGGANGWINLRGSNFVNPFTAGGTVVDQNKALAANLFNRQFVYDASTQKLIGIVSQINASINQVLLVENALAPITTGDMLYFTGIPRWQCGPPEIRFYWTVKVLALLANFQGQDVSCMINRWKPAHTIPIFDYSPLQDLDASRPWDSGYIALL